jgi:hypothetical protein
MELIIIFYQFLLYLIVCRDVISIEECLVTKTQYFQVWFVPHTYSTKQYQI